MEHAVTFGEVLVTLLVVGGLFGAGALLLFLVWLFNPFRSGH